MDALEIKEVAGLRAELDARATTQYVDGSDLALQLQIDQVQSDLIDLENEVAVHETRLDELEAQPVYNPGHTHTASQVTDFSAAVGALIGTYNTQLQDGVPATGNTLQKLYNLILGQFSEVSVTTLAARDALSIVRLPTNVFVQDDGDGRWALYRAISTGQPASYVKLSDPDLLGATLSASQIKASYESNPDTNAFTNALLAKLQGLTNYTDAQALAASKTYIDAQDTDLRNQLANKTNNATTAALSGRVATLEQVIQPAEVVAGKEAFIGLTPRAALLQLINANTATPPPTSTELAAPAGLVPTAQSANTISVSWGAVANATGYQLQRATSPDFAQNSATFYTGTERSFMDTGLAAATPHYYRVLAVGGGAFLTSPYSAAQSAATFASNGNTTAPAQVVGLVLAPSDTTLTASWEVPANGGAPITDYRVEIRDTAQNGNQFNPVAHAPSNGTSLVISGLANGGVYQVRVAAINGVGTGAYSDIVEGTPRFVSSNAAINHLSELIKYDANNFIRTWNMYSEKAVLASDEIGTATLGFTGAKLRLDLPTADNGCEAVEILVNGEVVGTISERGQNGATIPFTIDLGTSTGSNVLVIRRAPYLVALGYIAVNLFTPLDNGGFYRV